MSSNRAVSYGSSGLNSDVDWGWAAPAFQLYSSLADLSKVGLASLVFSNNCVVVCVVSTLQLTQSKKKGGIREYHVEVGDGGDVVMKMIVTIKR